MQLKDWFANRKKLKPYLEVKQLLSTEEYCALWTTCFQCRELLYSRDLHNNLSVCSKCGYHFRIGAMQRIEQLADPSSFEEINSSLQSTDPLKFTDTSPYPNRLKEASNKSGLTEAIVTGSCRIQGRTIALGAMDFSHFGGTMGSAVGEKVARLIEYALYNKLPLVIVCSSGGARMQEGILSMMQLPKICGALHLFHESKLLYVSILTEPTFGGVTASFGMLGDIIIAEPGARIGFAGRRVIEQVIKQKLPSAFQTAEHLLKHGQVDMVVERNKLKNTLLSLIEFHSLPDELVMNFAPEEAVFISNTSEQSLNRAEVSVN